MRFIPTAIPDVLTVEPVVHTDSRGFFMETWHAGKFRAAGLDLSFVQDNHSGSVRHSLRGLHYQIGRPQGKLVRVIEGEKVDAGKNLDKAEAMIRIALAVRPGLVDELGHAHDERAIVRADDGQVFLY